MIPTLRLLLLLLIGSVLVAGSAMVPALVWLAILYVLLIAAFVVVDYVVSPKPQDVEIERINDTKLSIGAENGITLLVSSRAQRSIRFQLRDEHPHQFASDALILRGEVRPFEVCELRYRLTPDQRGDYSFGDTNIRYTSLLGTFVRQHRYATAAPVKVYPNVLDVRTYDLLARKGMLFELGLRNARVYGSGTEFERLREYTSDDEFRRINWRATARRGKPIAAEYETERSQYVMSVIDSGRLMRSPIGDLAKLDYAINAALLLSYVAGLKGDHTGLLTFADDVRDYLAPKRGKAQFQRMLETLYNVQFEPVEADYAQALAYLSLKQKRRSLIILFTDIVTLDAAKPLITHMARLAQRHLPLCVVLSDPHISAMAGQPAESSTQIYQRAVAELLLDERQVVLDTLNSHGVLTLDVPADKLSIALINKYLELKGRGAI